MFHPFEEHNVFACRAKAQASLLCFCLKETAVSVCAAKKFGNWTFFYFTLLNNKYLKHDFLNTKTNTQRHLTNMLLLCGFNGAVPRFKTGNQY